MASVESLADRVEKAAGKRPKIVDAAKLGIRIVQLQDPDGNILQFSSAWSRP